MTPPPPPPAAGAARRSEPSDEYRLTDRAHRQAVTAELGEWIDTLRANASLDEHPWRAYRLHRLFAVMWLGLSALLLAGVVVAVILDIPGVPVFGSWSVVVPLGILAVLFLVSGVRSVQDARRQRPRALAADGLGPLLVHLFEAGTILERTGGVSFTMPRDSTDVDLVTWDDGWDNGSKNPDPVQLWLTTTEHGTLALRSEGAEEIALLGTLAIHHGLDDAPRRIEPPDRPPDPA